MYKRQVHSKLTLITSKVNGKYHYLTQIGTGNYNEKTSELYTDLSFITTRQEIGEEASAVFNNMALQRLTSEADTMLVAPLRFKSVLLEQMDRTEQQLREKLKQGGYPQACIDLALEYVKSFHYVDDYRYACTYINYRQDRMSRYQLKVKLYGKGIPGELIDRALEECYEGDEQEQIIRLLEKKKFDAQNSDPKEFTRVYQYLMRRGFRSNDVLRAMKSKQ